MLFISMYYIFLLNHDIHWERHIEFDVKQTILGSAHEKRRTFDPGLNPFPNPYSTSHEETSLL